jgi:hypothetical protein
VVIPPADRCAVKSGPGGANLGRART